MVALSRAPAPRVLVYLTLATIALLVGANLCAQHLTATVDESALGIASNAAPSLRHLSNARGRVGAITHAAHLTIEAGVPIDAQQVKGAEEELEGDLANYVALPHFPGEAELFEIVKRTIAALEASVARAIVTGASGDAEARLARATDVTDQFDLADNALENLIAFNAAEATRLQVDVASTHLRARRLSYVLDGLAATLAMLFLLLATNGARAREHAVEERERLMEARNVELDLFAGRVAHDLTNPLTAVALSLSLIQRYEPSHDQLGPALTRVQKNVERMSQTIDGFLRFAQAGAKADPSARADVAEVVSTAIDAARRAAELAHADLRVDLPGAAWVHCPPALLTSVVSNLVQNAVKYITGAPEGTRRIEVRVKNAVTGRVRVEVQDTGPGIPRGLERTVFEPFVRVGKNTQPGTGLGLATVKRIVEAYGGEVGVESGDENGSRFWFELPEA
ncbi:MAG: ATP-binding protein [Polyangiaceae bacterium]